MIAGGAVVMAILSHSFKNERMHKLLASMHAFNLFILRPVMVIQKQYLREKKHCIHHHQLINANSSEIRQVG